MIFLKQFFFEPDSPKGKEIKPVVFERGMNFVIGEKSDSPRNEQEGEKMNGVGKSLLIEAINFCLLKKADESRVMKIPDLNLNPNVYFCLELEVETKARIRSVTIKRNRNEKDPIILIIDGNEQSFDDLNEARKYLSAIAFVDAPPEHPSFRSMLSILIRDEESRYNDILKPFYKSDVVSFEDLLKPHFYLFQIDLSILEKIKKASDDLKDLAKTLSSLRDDFKRQGIQEKEVASYINELTGSVDKLNLAIKNLQPSEGLVQEQSRLNDLQVRLDKLITEKANKEYLTKKIKVLPELEQINTKQIQIVYNKFKAGLGDLVQKSFDQVIEFKKQVDDFQNSLLTEKLNELNAQISVLDSQIAEIDTAMGKIYGKLGAREKIDSLAETVKIASEKNRELNELSTTYEILQNKKQRQKVLKKKKDDLVEELSVITFKVNSSVKLFEEDLKKMHEYIAGNTRCQFEINIDESVARFVNFDYRIKLDGSSGINRIKTFIYDALLMTNKVTSQRHFRFLIHDNIFASTGRDDMVKSLNYLFDLSKKHTFQYIVTINKDEFESQIDKFSFDYTKLKRAEFTRQNPFLGFEYSEL